jgi:hypothetical protein
MQAIGIDRDEYNAAYLPRVRNVDAAHLRDRKRPRIEHYGHRELSQQCAPR